MAHIDPSNKQRRTRLAVAAVIATTVTATALATVTATAATGSTAGKVGTTASRTATADGHSIFLGPLHTVSTIASTVPANGDVNPYGTAVVPRSTGALVKGNVLISNFNAVSNAQGTGTTIVQVSPWGGVTQFAAIDAASLPGPCQGGVGLTTALSVLRSGWVIVGSLPTSDGTAATAQAGCLIVLDSHGKVRETITGHGLNGPWDMTSLDFGDVAELFVTNVLNGTVAANGATVDKGTVVRLVITSSDEQLPKVLASTVIGSGFGERTDPAALVVGPTGVGLDEDGTLFVADSVGNRIASIPDAPWRSSSDHTGHTVTTGGWLNTPLGLAVAPNGDVLTVNALDGNMVETTPWGVQVAARLVDNNGSPAGSGALFGLAVAPDQKTVYFVDDATNTLNLLAGP